VVSSFNGSWSWSWSLMHGLMVMVTDARVMFVVINNSVLQPTCSTRSSAPGNTANSPTVKQGLGVGTGSGSCPERRLQVRLQLGCGPCLAVAFGAARRWLWLGRRTGLRLAPRALQPSGTEFCVGTGDAACGSWRIHIRLGTSSTLHTCHTVGAALAGSTRKTACPRQAWLLARRASFTQPMNRCKPAAARFARGPAAAHTGPGGAILAGEAVCGDLVPTSKSSSPEGLEPTRAEHNGLAGHRLNHSAKATRAP
jgi:hypothetical protein